MASNQFGRARRAPVSVVCVYNDQDVLDRCLARSVSDGLSSAPETELIAVDNRGNAFSSAGLALNHGARMARHDVVVFVHQDVVLHSLIALEEAAAILLDHPDVGIAGAIGMDARDRLTGRIRDRVVRVGRTAAGMSDVDSLDEVLFLVRRQQLESEPLIGQPDLAWHGYAVEYCARMRRAGMRSVVLDIPLTHNSLTTNLKGLDVAHARIGRLHPGLLPIRTTCGTIWSSDSPRGIRRVAHYGRRGLIWWREKREARRLSRLTGSDEVVVADVRMLVDEALARSGMTSLRVIELDADVIACHAVSNLVRLGRPFTTMTATPTDVRSIIESREPDELVLITAPDRSGIAALGPLGDIPHVVGLTHDTGVWVMVGAAPARLRPLWQSARKRPLASYLASRRRPAPRVMEA